MVVSKDSKNHQFSWKNQQRTPFDKFFDFLNFFQNHGYIPMPIFKFFDN